MATIKTAWPTFCTDCGDRCENDKRTGGKWKFIQCENRWLHLPTTITECYKRQWLRGSTRYQMGTGGVRR
jgi:hypothetical protein